jgi:hypothetical protein
MMMMMMMMRPILLFIKEFSWTSPSLQPRPPSSSFYITYCYSRHTVALADRYLCQSASLQQNTDLSDLWHSQLTPVLVVSVLYPIDSILLLRTEVQVVDVYASSVRVAFVKYTQRA